MNEYTTPLILKCNISGREQKLYHRPYIDSLIAKHGSLEKLLSNYVAKGVKKTQGKPMVTPSVVGEKICTTPLAKVNYNDIKPEPSHVNIREVIDGETFTCTVYENYG